MRTIDSKPVFDADKSVIIQITQSDCERGSKKDPAKCAAALALKRTTGCDECRVHVGCTYLRFGTKWLRYATPASLRAEIISFDRGGGFYPGDFQLHPIPKGNRLKLIGRKPGPKPGSKPKANLSNPVTATIAARVDSDSLSTTLEQEGADERQTKTTAPKGRRRGLAKSEREPRVFHRVKGIRERANTETRSSGAPHNEPRDLAEAR